MDIPLNVSIMELQVWVPSNYMVSGISTEVPRYRQVPSWMIGGNFTDLISEEHHLLLRVDLAVHRLSGLRLREAGEPEGHPEATRGATGTGARLPGTLGLPSAAA